MYTVPWRGWTRSPVSYTHLDVYKRQALASAGTQSAAPVVGEREGRNYNIDLRGCGGRDESDIDLIVEKLEARMRAAER